MANRSDILDRMSALADSTRSRLLLLLEGHELTVGELCTIVQLPQSTVSRHLKILADQGWVVSRVDGTNRRYHMPVSRLAAPARRLWFVVRDDIAEAPGSAHDDQRLRSVLGQRLTASREFFSSVAGRWDRLRTELFGPRAEFPALLGLLDERVTVGDLGCGTGLLAESLAPFVGRVIAVDGSSAMLDSAKQRLAKFPNVECRDGALESLPVGDGELDAAVLFLVLHYIAEPPRILAEVHRALAPRGRLLLVDMLPHEREQYRQEMGHVWLGFGQEQTRRWLDDAGLTIDRYVQLPPEPTAKGPSLFAATARRGT